MQLDVRIARVEFAHREGITSKRPIDAWHVDAQLAARTFYRRCLRTELSVSSTSARMRTHRS
jgi:hypothetical protein